MTTPALVYQDALGRARRSPHYPRGCEVHLLTREMLMAALQQLGDWWAWAGHSSREPWEAAFLVIKRPSRNYVRILQGQGPDRLQISRQQFPRWVL